VINRTGGNISQYAISPDGSLTPISTAVAVGKHPIFIRIAPSGKYAYVVNQNSNSISQYSLAENGSLIPMMPATVASLLTPVCIAVTRSGKYAYVTNIGSNDVSQYAIGEQGGLMAIQLNAWGDIAISAETSPRCVMTVDMKSSAV